MCESWEYQSPAMVVGKRRIRVAILWGRLLVGGRIIDGYNKLVWGVPLICLLKNNFSTYKVPTFFFNFNEVGATKRHIINLVGSVLNNMIYSWVVKWHHVWLITKRLWVQIPPEQPKNYTYYLVQYQLNDTKYVSLYRH